MEQAVQDAARECERAAQEAILQAAVVDAPKVRVDGRVLFAVGQFDAEYHTAAGPVRIVRPLYPRSPRLHGNVPLARSSIIWLAAPGKALGRLPYHRSSFERIGHAVGALYVGRAYEVDQALIEAFEVPKGAVGLAVSFDRVLLPMEEPDPTRKPTKDGPKRPIARSAPTAWPIRSKLDR